MNKLTALITTIVLGSSSVALAGTQVRDHRTYRPAPASTVVAPAPIVKPHFVGRFDARLGARTQPVTWMTLANNVAIDGRAMIDVRPMNRKFSKLELRADGNGRTTIDKVIVTFGNGRSQTIDLDAKLGKKQQVLAIDLKGEARTIDRIVVVGKRNGRNASVDVRAI